jgi:3-oxoacyl-[acyl-carrier protein] reductase
MTFEGKVAVVTGAAGGLGAAYAAALAAKGAAVAIVDRDLASAEAMAEFITNEGGRAIALGAELAEWDAVEKCVRTIETSMGRIDILINNAGGGSSSPGNASSIEAIAPSAWSSLVDSNLTTAFMTIRAAAPVMKRQRYGKIVNISSRSARVSDPKFEQSPAYACAKTAILGLTRFAARELGPYGITVNCLVPGLVLSGPVLEDYWMRLSTERQKSYLEDLALRRLPRMEEIVGPVLFLCGDGSDYISGVSLDVNGGSFMPA